MSTSALELNNAPRSKGLQLCVISSRRVDQTDVYFVKLFIYNGTKFTALFLEVDELLSSGLVVVVAQYTSLDINNRTNRTVSRL